MVKTQDDIGSAEEYRQYLQSSADGWDSAAVGKLLSDGNSDKVIAELANLSKLDYGRRRKTAAKAMGVPVAILDEVVIEHRTRREVRDAALPHWTVEAWPEVVDGAALLNEITEILKQYVVLPEHIPETVALWVVHTWTFGASEISPYLAPISPTKRCGKTSLLVLLNWLTRRSEIASNISSAALFRYIEEHHPTLLVDEADSFLESNEELRGVLNSGHTRAAAYVIRCDGQDNKPRRFSTWAPKAIALIGRLPETLADRSIIVAMKRKRRDEKVARLRRRDCEAYAVIRQKSLRWANDNRDALEQADPKELPSLNDRAMDNWRPLLAIADRAGGDWIELATKAALALSGDETDAAENIRVELLADIQRAFGADDRLWTTTLLAELAKHPERPWAEWKHGKPLNARQLGGLLRPFGIISETVRIDEATAKGYHRSWFKDAFERYLPPGVVSDPSQRHNACSTGTSAIFSSVTKDKCDGCENANLSYSHSGCDVVTDMKPKTAGESEFDHGEGRLCAHCGQPDFPGSRLLECWVDGAQTWGHQDCLEQAWRDWPGSS